MASSQQYFEIRKALSWSAIHKMKTIWCSKMENSLKIRTFKATIEPILLYGSECWTIDSTIRKQIDVVIPGYLELPQIYHGKIRSLIYNCTGECQRSLR